MSAKSSFGCEVYTLNLRWLRFVILFPLTEMMDLTVTDVDVAHYIFFNGLLETEVLEKNYACFLDRSTLWTLSPGQCMLGFVSEFIDVWKLLLTTYVNRFFMSRSLQVLHTT